MNLNDKNIDQLFRKGADNMEAPEYNDAYWDEMSQIIDADAKSRKKLIAWVFSGVLGVAVIVFLLFLNVVQLNEEATFVSSNTEITEQLDEKITTSKNDASNSEFHDGMSEKNTQKFVAKDDINDKTPHSNFEKSETATNKELLSRDKTNKEDRSTSVKVDKSSSDQLEANTGKNQRVSSTTPSDFKTDNKTIANRNDPLTVEHTNSSVNTLPIKLIAMETNSEVDQNLISIKNLMNRWRVSYHAEAAFGVSESYQSNTSSPWRYSAAGIIRLKYNQLVIQTGFGVQVESPANLQVTERAKVYGFGLNNYENILNYKSFTQLYVPLEIGYKSNNSTFGIGGQFHTIVGTRMSLTSKVNQEITAQKDFNNQTAGLNRYSGNFYLWIDQQLTDKISAGVRVGSAIGTRIADSHYFNTLTNEQPIFGQLTLKYQLFK